MANVNGLGKSSLPTLVQDTTKLYNKRCGYIIPIYEGHEDWRTVVQSPIPVHCL